MTNLGSARDESSVNGETRRAPRQSSLDGPLDYLFSGALGKVIGFVAAAATGWALLTGQVQHLLQRDSDPSGGINGRVSLHERRIDDLDARVLRMENAQGQILDRLTRIESKVDGRAGDYDGLLKELKDLRRDLTGRMR